MTGKARTESAGKTDPGRVRELNEDYYLLTPERGLYLVCDGMGGHASGNVASNLAARSIENFFLATEIAFDEEKHPDDGDAPLGTRRLASAIRKANSDVYEISSTHERHKGMGTTAVALYLEGDTAHIAHVGDSRVYRVRDGELKQLTRDHSLHNEALALKPNLSAERLARLPKNVVTRALGMKGTVQVESKHETVQPGDLFLLCSDGLYNMVKEDDLVGLLAFAEDLDETVDLLIATANDSGGSDNISAVLVRCLDIEPESVVVASKPRLELASEPHLELVVEGPPVVWVVDEPPPWTPLPEPSDEVLTPSKTIALFDAANDELAEIEEALAAIEFAREERHRNAFLNQPRCGRCAAPLPIDVDYCVDCGAPIG